VQEDAAASCSGEIWVELGITRNRQPHHRRIQTQWGLQEIPGSVSLRCDNAALNKIAPMRLSMTALSLLD